MEAPKLGKKHYKVTELKKKVKFRNKLQLTKTVKKHFINKNQNLQTSKEKIKKSILSRQKTIYTDEKN